MLPTHSPLGSQDVKVNLYRNRFAVVRNWSNRHDAHPLIAEQIVLARESPSFELMHRGDKWQPSEVFTFGVKARPALHEGDLGKLEWELGLVADNRQKWADLVRDFLDSPMGKQMAKGNVPSERLMLAFDEKCERKRRRLAELLLLGLQYQNYQQSVEHWRELLFLIYVHGTTGLPFGTRSGS